MATLSPREVMIVQGLAAGRGLHEIAAEMGLSHAAVRSAVVRARHRAGAATTCQLVATAVATGLVVVAGQDERMATAAKLAGRLGRVLGASG